MADWKKASRLKLRFNTDKGGLSPEQLWDLPLTGLANLTRAAKKVLNKAEGDDDLSFLDSSKQAVNVEDELRFDILKEVYLDKKDDADKKKREEFIKQEEQKLLSLIEKKKEASLEDNSIEELEAKLAKLRS